MKNKKTKILILLFVISILGSLYLMRIITEPLKDIQSAKADIVLNAPELIVAFEKNEEASNEKYVDQIIKLTGIIKDITTEGNKPVITLSGGDEMSTVLCHLNPEEQSKLLNLEKNQSISIKGICTGFLLDVIMVRCVIVEN